jgi:hypothetical protein
MKNGIKKIRDLLGWGLIIIVGAIAANIGKELGARHMGPAVVAAMRSTAAVPPAAAPAPAPPISPATINQTEAHRADEVAIAHARQEARRDAERCTAARAAAREAPIVAEQKRHVWYRDSNGELVDLGIPRDLAAEAAAIEPAPVDPDVAQAERTASRTCLRAEQSQREADALTELGRLTDAAAAFH